MNRMGHSIKITRCDRPILTASFPIIYTLKARGGLECLRDVASETRVSRDLGTGTGPRREGLM